MSKIEWTDQTYNPIIGCSKTSPGCDNCYAEKMAARLAKIKATKYYKNTIVQHPLDPRYGQWNGNTHFVGSALEKPLKRKKPTKYFVCSMGDLFHESVPFEWIDWVMAIMAVTPHHTYQILTKRPERALEYFKQKKEVLIDNLEKAVYEIGISDKNEDPDAAACYIFNRAEREWPFKNIWLGVTAENQEQANKRIQILSRIPAVVRFASIEPMLSGIDLWETKIGCTIGFDLVKNGWLDWVIVGGESGPKARPMHPDWVRSIRDQCQDADVPFFFKQWGEFTFEKKQIEGEPTCVVCGCTDFNACEGGCHWVLSNENFDICSKCRNATVHCKLEDNTLVFKVGKKKAGRLLDGKEYNEFPKF